MSESGDNRRGPRGRNFGMREQMILCDLVILNKGVLENRRTDAVTNRKKEDCWKNMELDFNSRSSIKRSWQQLRSGYESLKKKAKKQAAAEKQAQMIAGGEPYRKVIDEVSEKILDLIGHGTEPLNNEYDDDGDNELRLVYEGDESYSMPIGNQHLPSGSEEDPPLRENAVKVSTQLEMPPRLTVHTRKQKHEDNKATKADRLSRAIEVLKDMATPQEDEFDIFGKLIACHVRQMPLLEAVNLQGEILKMVINKRIELLNQNSTPERVTFLNSTRSSEPP